MMPMMKWKKHPSPGEKGFTLVELVVVIAILGVLAAIATPLVVNFLGQSKESAYKAEVDVLQAAVEGYLADPNNPRFVGVRTYPIVGRGQTVLTATTVVSGAAVKTDIDDDQTAKDGDPNAGADAITAPYWNPLGGTQGADLTAKWTDSDGDGLRDFLEASDFSADNWSSVAVKRQLIDYQVDPRYYFIDMEELVAKKFMDKAPKSAATENCPGTPANCKGSYIWYVDNNGRVVSLLNSFPNKKGFQALFP